MGKREQRRIAGYLKKYVPDGLLNQVADPRSLFGRRWSLAVIIRMLFVGCMSGCRGLGEIEALSSDLSAGARRLLGVPRRLADTTMRSTLCRILPNCLRKVLHMQVHDAFARKALAPTDGFPFQAVSMDGKYVSVKTAGKWAQAQSESEWSRLRTVTSTLVTAAAKPCIDAFPIAAETNEMGAFEAAFNELLRVYGDRLKLFMYDSGAASAANAACVANANRHYLFVLDAFQSTMFEMARLLLQGKPAAHREETIERYDKPGKHSQRRQVKTLRFVQVRPTRKNLAAWEHARTFLEVRTDTYEGDRLTPVKSWVRHYVTSLDAHALSAHQWLRLITLRWSVETSHQVFDTAFEEDDRPAIVSSELGALAFILLRRIAYTLLALYRGVTLRSDEHRTTPWKRVMQWFRNTLLKCDVDTVQGLRGKSFALPPAYS